MTENVAYTQAQQTALGIAITDPRQISDIFIACQAEDFEPPFRQVAEAIQGLRGKDISALSVIDEMQRRGTTARLPGGPVFVHELAQWGYGSAEYACGVISRVARVRTLHQLSQRLNAETLHVDADPHAIAKLALEQAQGVLDHIEAEGDITTPRLDEFLNTSDPAHDWVVPGLLERGDRLVLTGSEGLGKSVLQRQIAVATAAGIHPFTHKPIQPQTVLYVDCENGPVKLRRALRGLAEVGKQYGSDPTQRMFIEAIPQGLDLTKADDEMWLVRLVSAIQPALFLTGPIYRLHAGNPNDEEPARKVAQVLDRCRVAANCAVVTEAHAGHGYGGEKRPIRPTGSSLWLRWPEFGYGMRATDDYDPKARVVDFTSWRGDREERDWPDRLEMGGQWPWRAVSNNWTPTTAIGA
jgi:replicative DNA helicase